ncbi:hypothetical protein ACTWPT_13470 [Nonomuraea sp. 3N208]|uniref:hypothetical protein n=1 Tax=Nonomuraea sp. 3N208 TaxID=3457421 RepID=UPI003FCD7F13
MPVWLNGSARPPSPTATFISSGRLFNLIIFGLIIAGLFVVVFLPYDLWLLWFHGKSVAAQPLWWDMPVALWGRIGKVMQFAAGLAVVIDLIDPGKLRKRGRVASARLRKRRADLRARLRPYRLHALRRDLYQSFVTTRQLQYGLKEVYVSVSLPRSFSPDVSFSDAPFSEDEYVALYEQLVARFGRGKKLSDQQTNVIKAEIRTFLDQCFSPADRAGVQRVERRRNRMFVVAGLAVLASLLFFLVSGQSEISLYVHSSLVMAVLWLLLPMDAYALALPGLVREIPPLTVGYLGTHLLDRARPLHAFRKVAVVLFITGFALDLLAS